MPFSHIFFFSKRFWYGWGDGEVQLRDFVLKGANLQPSTNTYTRKKSMGDNSDNFCEFLNVCMLGTLETTFRGQKTFFLVRNAALFHGGGGAYK